MEKEHAVPLRFALPVLVVTESNDAYGTDLVISHACEWPSLTVQWLPVYLTAP